MPFLQCLQMIMDEELSLRTDFQDTPGNISFLTHPLQCMITDPVDDPVIAFVIMSLEYQLHFSALFQNVTDLCRISDHMGIGAVMTIQILMTEDHSLFTPVQLFCQPLLLQIRDKGVSPLPVIS